MMEEIKKAHALVQDKLELYQFLADKFNIEPLSVRNNWFCNKLAKVPKMYQREVLNILLKEIKIQEQNE